MEANAEWDERHDDLFRAGIVLCISAMDAYFTDRFCEEFTKHVAARPKLNKTMLDLITDAGLTTTKSLEMFNSKRPNRILSNMIRAHLSGRVTQNFKNIDELYVCFGYKNFTKSAQGLLNRRNLLTSINGLIERRHKIVHAGDYNSRGQLNKIDYKMMLRKIVLVRKLVASCDNLMLKKSKSKKNR
jgi:hypothetical protein